MGESIKLSETKERSRKLTIAAHILVRHDQLGPRTSFLE